VSAPSVRARTHSRRLARRTLPGLLRYKFLHEYGYDKGEVVVEAIVADICEAVRNYFVGAEDLEPGQLVYYCPEATDRARKGRGDQGRTGCPGSQGSADPAPGA
jgi:hypothetical protein